MKIKIALLSIILALPISAEEQLPREVRELLSKRDKADEKIDLQFNKALEKLKNKYLSNKDLDGANAVASILDGKTPIIEEQKKEIKDELVDTTWTFLGINKQEINQFEFKTDGSVKCDKAYRDATWERLDDDHILFRYAPKDAFIVFHITRGNMQGYHSGNGRIRYLTQKK
jgi:hypothetical protein